MGSKRFKALPDPRVRFPETVSTNPCYGNEVSLLIEAGKSLLGR